MAVNNLNNYTDAQGLGFPLNFRRGNPNPLDNSSVWSSYEAASTYAQTSPVAYVGQILAVVDAAGKTAKFYGIQDTAGTLKEVGAATKGDDKSIVLTGEILSIKGINEAEVGAQLVKDADGSVKWVVPSTETVDGLAANVADLLSRMSAVEGKVTTLETTVGGESSGLVKEVADIKTNINDNYYTKTQTDQQISTAISGVVGENVSEAFDTLKEVETWIGEHENGAASMLTSIGKNADDISALQGKMTTAEGDITTLKSDMTTAKSDISGLQAVTGGTLQVGEVTHTTLKGYIDAKDAALKSEFDTAIGGLGALASLDKVAEANLETALADKINGKADKVTSAVAGNFAGLDVNGNLTDSGKKADDFATAAQGGKADTALQGVKVNGSDLSIDSDKKVNVTVTEGSANGTVSVNGSDVSVKGLGSAAYTEAGAYATAAQGTKADSAVQSVTVLGTELTDGEELTVAAAKTALGLKTAAYTDSTDYATAAQGTKADSAVQSVTIAGHVLSDGGEVTTDQIKSDLGLGSAAYTEAGAYATAAQGASAESALQNVTILGTTLDKNSSSLTVNQAKTALGLKSAAYTESSDYATAGHDHDADYDAKGAAAAVQGSTTETVASVDAKAVAAQNAANTAQGEVDALETYVGTFTPVGEETTVVGYVDAKINAIPAQVDYSVTVSESTPEGYAKAYTFSQKGSQIATINIPKDMVVSSGSVVTDPKGQPAGTYIELVLANATSDKIYVNVSDLIEYVTGGTATDGMITISVDSEHVATAVINDATITLAKLATSVQTEINKAHTHDNKAVIDGITSSQVTGWDAAAADKHTHANKAVIDGITDVKVAAWDAAQPNVIESVTSSSLSVNTNSETKAVSVEIEWGEF